MKHVTFFLIIVLSCVVPVLDVSGIVDVGTDPFGGANQHSVQYTTNMINYYVYPLPDGLDYAESVLDDAFTAWADVTPDLRFIRVDSVQESNLQINWVKDFGGLHIGYALGANFIEIGLGDSSCGDTWRGYHPSTIQNIAIHEIGHILGHDHSPDPNNIMYPNLQNKQYLHESYEQTTAPGYIHYFPLCTSRNISSYDLQISADNTDSFDVYFIPSHDEFDNFVDGSFQYYSDSQCWAKNVQEFRGTCNDLSRDAGLLVALPSSEFDGLVKLSIVLQETAPGSVSENVVVRRDEPKSSLGSFTGLSKIASDKKHYKFGDIVTISGKLIESNRGDKIEVIIRDPTGTDVSKTGIRATSSGDFETLAILTSRAEGEYTASIYGIHDVVLATIKFSVGNKAPIEVDAANIDNTAPLIIIPSNLVVRPSNNSGAFVNYSVKAIDNVDGVVSPECGPIAGSFFPIGDTTVTCSASDLAANRASKSFMVTVESVIPSRIKETAGSWCKGDGGDHVFVDTVRYMIDNNIVSDAKEPGTESGIKVPKWIKNNMCLWSAKIITDDEFVESLEYLIVHNIIKIGRSP